jgi:hypothetical protein
VRFCRRGGGPPASAALPGPDRVVAVPPAASNAAGHLAYQAFAPYYCAVDYSGYGPIKVIPPPMQSTIIRFDVVHELAFVRPTFGFADRPSQVLKIFYETIAPRFPIATEHLTIIPSNVLSEVQIRIGLFNNLAPLELRSERMTLRFPNVNQADMALINDATILAYDALMKAQPELARDTSRFNAYFWLKVEGGAEGVQLLFKNRATPSKPIQAQTFGANTSSHYVKVSLKNEVEKWDVSINTEPSMVAGSDLFVLLITSFYPGTPHAEIHEQIEFVKKIVSNLWPSLGLELVTPGSSAP